MQLNIVQLNKQLSSLKTEKEQFTTKFSLMETENVKHLETIKLLQAEVSEWKAKYENGKKEEAAIVIAVSDSVNKEVVQKLSTIGIKEGTIPEDVSVQSKMETDPNEIYKKYELLTGKDKIDFYHSNKKSILKVMNSISVVNVNPIPANYRKF